MSIQQKTISVVAPARLHMGFMDLSGSLGRDFGSVGVALNEINTRLTITAAETLQVNGAVAGRARQCAQDLCQQLNVDDAVKINIEAAIPEHVGLGSGTQLSLAVGVALNAFYDLGLSIRDIACLTARGKRSGIGIGVFEQGGLVVDGGRGESTLTPPMISRMAVPDSWRFILVFDDRGQGLHGSQELAAFNELPDFPAQEAARLCYLLLMQGLPALAECKLAQFGEVISSIQSSVGQHFAAVQGGVFTSEEVAGAMAWLAQQGAVAIGQTSWGPTGFCAVDSLQSAERLVSQLIASQNSYSHLQYKIVSARNTPASVQFC